MVQVIHSEQSVVMGHNGQQIVVPLAEVPTLIMDLMEGIGVDESLVAGLFGETEVVPVGAGADQPPREGAPL